ncbi:NfeD family protein, partial [Salmonella enterica subsp. enterica serovar Infantis]
GDGSWPVFADEDLRAGTHGEGIAVDGLTGRMRAV